jgi:hypothetical protein
MIGDANTAGLYRSDNCGDFHQRAE